MPGAVAETGAPIVDRRMQCTPTDGQTDRQTETNVSICSSTWRRHGRCLQSKAVTRNYFRGVPLPSFRPLLFFSPPFFPFPLFIPPRSAPQIQQGLGRRCSRPRHASDGIRSQQTRSLSSRYTKKCVFGRATALRMLARVVPTVISTVSFSLHVHRNHLSNDANDCLRKHLSLSLLRHRLTTAVPQESSHLQTFCVTLSNLNRFSKFLLCWKAYEICCNTHTTLPTSR